jgi:hypothetical protein
MASAGMLRRVALVRTDVSEELSASFIRVTRIGELGTTLAVTSNRRKLQRNTQRASVASYIYSRARIHCLSLNGDLSALGTQYGTFCTHSDEKSVRNLERCSNI